MKKDFALKFIFSTFLVIAVFSGCSKRQKGYSATLKKDAESVQGSNPAVIMDDSDFFDYIAKVESGEIVEEPPIEENIAEQPIVEIPEGDTVEIKEKMFLTQINDIYFNFESYKNKTIIVEGMYTVLVSYFDKKEFPAVYRKGPGCCGNDGWGGFMLDWDGKMPKENDWIRVVGKPYIKENDGYEDLYLKVESLDKKLKRGAEFVVQ